LVNLNLLHASPAADIGSCLHCLTGKFTIEGRAIHHGCGHAVRLDGDRASSGASEACGAKDRPNRVRRQVEFLERVESEQPRAVHGLTYVFVLLEHEDRSSIGRQRASGAQAGRAGADYDHVNGVMHA
jgi:hypothetical protein